MQMQCRDFREVADSYLSDELLVETNHDVIAHLETCVDCRRELAARRELRTILRASFTKAEELQMPDEFASRLHNELGAAATSGAMSLNIRRRQWMIAAGLAVAVTFGAILVWQRQRAKTDSQIADKPQPQNTASVESLDIRPRPADIAVDANAILARMSELAAGDHRDCAIGHRLPDRPIPLEDAARKYDRAYLDLAEAVMSHRDDFDEVIELVMAHACLFKGQWFGHIVVRYRGRLVSLLVTKLEEPSGTATSPEKLPADLEGQVIACSTVGGYQISCFRTSYHGVFVVSDLDEGANLALARKLAPSVYEHIADAEHSG
jgi:hypothetical protein